MPGQGLRVTVAVDAPPDCPVAAVSRSTGEPVTDVARTAVGDDEVVEEFSTTADAVATDGGTGGAIVAPPAEHDLERVFEGPSATRFRFTRSPGKQCFCEALEAHGCPVVDVRGDDGALVVTFHAEAVDQVRDIVGDLSATFDDVSLRSLRQDGEAGGTDPVVVDRGRLTDRQREVLETATEMGYFEYPKGANAGDVADALDISVSTLAEHLAAAQTKVLDDVLA